MALTSDEPDLADEVIRIKVRYQNADPERKRLVEALESLRSDYMHDGAIYQRCTAALRPETGGGQ